MLQYDYPGGVSQENHIVLTHYWLVLRKRFRDATAIGCDLYGDGATIVCIEMGRALTNPLCRVQSNLTGVAYWDHIFDNVRQHRTRVANDSLQQQKTKKHDQHIHII